MTPDPLGETPSRFPEMTFPVATVLLVPSVCTVTPARLLSMTLAPHSGPGDPVSPHETDASTPTVSDEPPMTATAPVVELGLAFDGLPSGVTPIKLPSSTLFALVTENSTFRPLKAKPSTTSCEPETISPVVGAQGV